MSASREKKKRQGQDGTEVVVAKTGISKTGKKVLYTVVAIVLVAAIVFLGMVSSGFFNTHTTAGIANGHELTPAMLNYHYASAYQEMSSMLSYMADPETPLDEQEYLTEDYETWHDYLLDFALNSAASTYAIYDEAVANGYQLSDETKSALDAEVQMLEMYAAMSGFTSGDAYVAAMYGAGCDVENYLEFVTLSYTAQEYASHVYSEQSFSKEEIDARYAEDPNAFNGATFYQFNLTAEPAEGEEAVSDKALALIGETAEAMAEASKGDLDKFLELCVENTAEDEREGYDAASTLRENVTVGTLNETVAQWLGDEARQNGDTTAIANGVNGYYVLYFVEHADRSIVLPNVRHILVEVEDTTDAEAMAAAKAEAEALLAEFKAGEATEDAFAALASENTDDTGSAATGGLYENITPGAMVAPFDAWCFDANRQVNDTDIVETDFGYHVMFFAGHGDVYRDYLVETDLANTAYSQWQTDVTANLTWELISDKYVTGR